MSWKDDIKPDTEVRDIYSWPIEYTGTGEADDQDLDFYRFAKATQKELAPYTNPYMSRFLTIRSF